MRLIIEARVESADAATNQEPIRLAVIDRVDDDLEVLGLSLEEGRELIAAAQSAAISAHMQQWLSTQDFCRHCYTPLRHKDSRSLFVRTVFGKVSIQSPRFWRCRCGQRRPAPHQTVSPLTEVLRSRTTPELEYLQVKWAAHLPYATSTALLKEVLPLENCISTTDAKNRMRADARTRGDADRIEIVEFALHLRGRHGRLPDAPGRRAVPCGGGRLAQGMRAKTRRQHGRRSSRNRMSRAQVAKSANRLVAGHLDSPSTV
jgi:hypothetical protein